MRRHRPRVSGYPSHPPTTATAGDTLAWAPALAAYAPADGWAVSCAVVGTALTGTTTVEGGAWVVTIPGATTAAFGSGTLRYVLRATRAGATVTVAAGAVVLAADPSTAEGTTHAERMLATIQAVLEGRAGADAESYSVGGRSLTKIPMRDLVMLRDRYAARVEAERAGGATLAQLRWAVA